MLATRTSRMHEFSLHMKSDEVVDVINECADAVNTARELGLDLPKLAAVHTKLNALLGSKEQTRA
ncbi:hypothetical protein SEA_SEBASTISAURUS_25 [Streptomyces phage Sebastisaurus]|uniref:Uncharacterized protein n=1 Tax=Streptomyces phage Sebastisaurus TaxID=2510572 RepID=A0A411B3V9_9CAUD|nr:hypothetical protein SEA_SEBASTISAURUS_25 [Streptomyces phage Sebastisaurus]